MIDKYHLSDTMELIEERDKKVQEWNNSQGFLLPGGTWTEQTRVPSVFSLRAILVLTLFLLLWSFFPLVSLSFFLYAYYKGEKRFKLRKEISKLSSKIAKTLPVKLKKEELEEVTKIELGERLFDLGLIFCSYKEEFN